MNRPEVLEVMRIEHHLWRTCPCSVCEENREQTEQEEKRRPANSPIRHVSVETAFLLNLITSRCPEGSLARQLVSKPR